MDGGEATIIKPIKLMHQLKKVVVKLGLSSPADINTNSIQRILSHLVESYDDYKSISREALVIEISPILLSGKVFENNDSSSISSLKSISRVPSLNQTMAANLQKSAMAAKRQRPEDTSNTGAVNKIDPQVTDGSLIADIAPSTLNQSASSSTPLPTNQASDKKRKPNHHHRHHQSSSSLPSGRSFDEPLSGSSPFLTPRPATRFQDLAGLDNILKQIRELVCYPIQYPELYAHLGICPPCGILLHGPSGCGKTALGNAIAGETNLSYFKVRIALYDYKTYSNSPRFVSYMHS